ncbi:MAG: hypothetical protein J6S21_02400, partial [Victivallales bacterium]|nr:hypothetical protein [Victivallales bacterium]
MKNTSALTFKVLAGILAMLLSAPLAAFNVKDFGAKGDGITDDTAAIQKAFAAAQKEMTYVPGGSSTLPKWGGHGGLGGGAEVFFPAGTYRVTAPIFYSGRRVDIRGQKGTVITADASTDIIYLHHILHSVIENIEFRGGKIQLNVFTNNNDMSTILVEKCTFRDAALESIRTINKGKGTSGNYNGQPPYNITKNEQGVEVCTVNPEYETTTRRMPNSTIFSVVDCTFESDSTVISGGADTFNMDRCQVLRRASVRPIFEVDGFFNMRRTTLKYTGTSSVAPKCWLDSKPNIFYLKECSFDNGGTPFPVVYSSRKPGYLNISLQITDCDFRTAGAPLVKYAAGTHTGILTLQNNRCLDESKAPLVAYERIPSLGEMENVIRYVHQKGYPIKTQFKFIVDGNQGFNDKLPESIAYFLVKPLPAEEVKAADVIAKDVDFWPAEKDYKGKIIPVGHSNERSFAKSLQAACRKAKAGDTILVPAKHFKLNASVDIPGGVRLMSLGRAVIEAEGELDSMLKITGSGSFFCRNLVLVGGKTAVNVAAQGGRYVFKNCHFLNQDDTGVLAMNKPEGIQLRDGLCYTKGLIRTNALHSEIIRNWFCNSPLMNEKGLVQNQGGDMLVEYNLSVPILPRMNLENGKPTPGCENLDNGNNVRWVDCNGGRTAIFSNRFGGEFIGMTPAYTSGSDTSLIIRGGYSWFGNIYTRKCSVFCQDEPKRVLLQGIIFNGEGRIAISNEIP